jgi:hypothetical protein
LKAVYSALATTYGGFSDYIEITTLLQKSIADAIVGSTASISNINNNP